MIDLPSLSFYIGPTPLPFWQECTPSEQQCALDVIRTMLPSFTWYGPAGLREWSGKWHQPYWQIKGFVSPYTPIARYL